MRIGELARRVGVNPKTIRFYEDQGLLPPPARRPSGYRDYSPADEARLTFVRTAQRLGFSLVEIEEILALKDRGEPPCSYVLSVLDARVADIDRRLGELMALRTEHSRTQGQRRPASRRRSRLLQSDRVRRVSHPGRPAPSTLLWGAASG